MTHLERLGQSGIRRLGSAKRGFRYRTAQGRPLPGSELERIRRLAPERALLKLLGVALPKAHPHPGCAR